MQTSSVILNNPGFLIVDLTEDEVLPIKREIDKIRTSEDRIPFNDELVGHLREEYGLVECKEYVQSLVMPLIDIYERSNDHLKSVSVLTNNLPFTLSSLWVNFQKKHEFNPIHAHSGVFSFALWIQNPFNIEDEMAVFPLNKKDTNMTAHFCFYYVDNLGKIQPYKIPCDRRYQNKLVFFPSSLNHCVYPFYTSDEYRISVSGNISLQA